MIFPPSESWTHPPTSKLISDFCNFAKPVYYNISLPTLLNCKTLCFCQTLQDLEKKKKKLTVYEVLRNETLDYVDSIFKYVSLLSIVYARVRLDLLHCNIL